MAPGDEWLGIEVQGQGWRISKLDDVGFYAGSQKQLTAVVARDGRLRRVRGGAEALVMVTAQVSEVRSSPATGV